MLEEVNIWLAYLVRERERCEVKVQDEYERQNGIDGQKK